MHLAGRAALTSFVLGAVCMAGVYVGVLSGSSFWNFGLYVSLLAVFHQWEFVFAATFHANDPDLSDDAYLLNHSSSYHIALAAACVEYVLELYAFPSWKLGESARFALSLGGLAVAVAGLAVRVVSMVQAGRAFTHVVAEERRPEHDLVTSGLYRYVRHPGYAGWFYWSVGSQLLLLNPLCAVGFAYVSFRFFRDRIEHEEALLVDFFGSRYQEYRKRTPTFIPGIP